MNFNCAVRCDNLLINLTNEVITYTPPRGVSSHLQAAGHWFTGTIATYSCSQGYQLVGGSSSSVCGPNGTWNGTKPSCGEQVYNLITGPGNTCV